MQMSEWKFPWRSVSTTTEWIVIVCHCSLALPFFPFLIFQFEDQLGGRRIMLCFDFSKLFLPSLVHMQQIEVQR